MNYVEVVTFLEFLHDKLIRKNFIDYYKLSLEKREKQFMRKFYQPHVKKFVKSYESFSKYKQIVVIL